MPTFVVPHRSGAHRVAAIALYRALLTQCKRTPLPAVHGEELYNLVKNRFRGFRHDTSHRHLKVAFEAGYEAVDYLDAAINGEVKAKDYILALLKRAPRNAKIDPRESPKQFLRRHYDYQPWPDHASSEEKEGPPTGHESDWFAPAEAQEMNESAHELFSKDTASFERSPKSTDDAESPPPITGYESQEVSSHGTEEMQLVQPSDSGQEVAQHSSPDEAYDFEATGQGRIRDHRAIYRTYEVESTALAIETESVTQSSGEGNISDGPRPLITLIPSRSPSSLPSYPNKSLSLAQPANLEHELFESKNGSHSTSDDPAIRPVRNALSEDERLSQSIFGREKWNTFRKHKLRDAKDKSTPLPKRNILSDPPIAKEDLGGTGKRHVPVLVNANGIPFLRYKKPMPANLASFINSRIEQRDRRHRLRQEMEQTLSLAHEEDKWDAIIYNTTGVDSREDGGDKVLWRHSAQSGLRQVTERLQAEKEKNRIHAEKMQAIVDREAELARLELEEDESKALGGFMDDITDQEATGDHRGQEAGLLIRYGDFGEMWQPEKCRQDDD
ncbi:hypothetical protein HII31_13213 [Pseudocercospora fuligena]|uniref:Complex 1 LYR protein domain-containing protein n=1 Tax=Pseudocercospora fuligena TaxID=685502 RepID=A0A8H6VBS7_9PEZI|nr:hypothetical protein HII31_13213 [Pseudocercospora fuligena]